MKINTPTRIQGENTIDRYWTERKSLHSWWFLSASTEQRINWTNSCKRSVHIRMCKQSIHVTPFKPSHFPLKIINTYILIISDCTTTVCAVCVWCWCKLAMAKFASNGKWVGIHITFIEWHSRGGGEREKANLNKVSKLCVMDWENGSLSASISPHLVRKGHCMDVMWVLYRLGQKNKFKLFFLWTQTKYTHTQKTCLFAAVVDKMVLSEPFQKCWYIQWLCTWMWIETCLHTQISC